MQSGQILLIFKKRSSSVWINSVAPNVDYSVKTLPPRPGLCAGVAILKCKPGTKAD